MSAIEDIFARVGWAAICLSSAEGDLLAVEQRIGRKLPAVFREFYSIEDARALLKYYSNSDRPLSVAELAEPMSPRWDNYDPVDDKILPFMIENQGVCVWGVRLDGGDDPPVVVEVDSGTPPRWQLCAERFSDWLGSQVENFRVLKSSWFVAQAPALSDSVVRLLRQHFEEGMQTHVWPGETNYRFCNSRSELVLWSTKGQSDWWIAPRSPDVVAAALDEIEEVAGIGKNIYAPREQDEETLRIWRESRQGG
jgi:hypothetical protein